MRDVNASGFRPAPSKEEMLMQDGPGRRLRKNVANVRKHIDYVANALNHVNVSFMVYPLSLAL